MSEKWVTVATYSQPVEAHLARTRLEADGIPCVVADEFLVRVNWLLSNAVGGVKLMVPAWDAARAREALRPRPRLVVVAEADASHPMGTRDEGGDEGERAADDRDREGRGAEDLICPRCRSFDVYFYRFDRRIAGLFWLMAGFIVPWRSEKWVCKECGYEWKERRRSG